VKSGGRVKKYKAETKESVIQNQILDYLQYIGVFAWRNNNIAVRGRAFVGLLGVGDILGIYKGVPLSIEVKRKSGKTTEQQNRFIKRFNQEGGCAFVARSINDVKKKLKKIEKKD
jgi:hypothetical protein